MSEATALIGVQGPKAEAIIQRLTKLALQRVARFAVAIRRDRGSRACVVARTGYTGEDGFELFVAAKQAGALFDAIWRPATPAGCNPAG